MSSIYVESFLVFDIFIAGMVASVALRHALAHYRPKSFDLDHHAGGHLPPAVREHILEEAQSNFEAVLRSATRDLQKDLQAMSDNIKSQVEELGKDATGKEVEHYKAIVAELQQQTKDDIKGVDKEADKEKAELKTKLATEMAAEKQRLVAQIDTKLADAVTSFLMETLQHDVDLGSQAAYLTKMLEEHKAEFAQEVTGGES